ncbi:tetratricopeptide repeat protein [Streptomyces sp. NPDC001165]|uniref:tetratricopeptide repeat protein n=1 Tax=Streptomyces sp. NPDC001165 TaxID=3364546 RepID=UPI0036846350
MSDHIGFHGGEFRGTVIGKAECRQQAAAPTALDALPPRAVGFTGRDEELTRLRDALNPSGCGEPQAVLVTAVSGLGGIGKTALAVEAAHAAREASWFPGGVLFVDLHGYDDAPVTADQALQSMLRALGVQPEHIPAAADERAALYRSLLAERNAVLLLADNASSPEQVRPLLPGSGRHRVLVTSRDRLAQLGARLVPLGQLEPGAACRLLDLALRITDANDSRVTDDVDAAERLAALCGYLPLALQIAAALLAEDRDMPVVELADELTRSHNRLVDLDDGERSVRAAFDLSYRRLPPRHARLLRLLALAPGPEVSDEGVAALIGAEAPPIQDLKFLARAHLVERGSRRGWWRMHDLVRVFGTGVVATDPGLWEEGEAARGRVLEFCLRWVSAADDRLRWLPEMTEPERFTSRAEALAWLDGERTGLLAAAQWAREERHASTAVRLALRLADYLSWRRYFDDWIITATAACEAAERTRDRLSQADAWNNLGRALRRVDRAREAIAAFTRARKLYQAVQDRQGEAIAWNHLGIALQETRRFREALHAHIRARDLFQAVEDRRREGSAWDNLGSALQEVIRAEEAIDTHARAISLFQAVKDRHREAIVWNNLGRALLKRGRTAEAVKAYDKASGIFREFEDWYGEGQALKNLATAHELAHRRAEAHAAFLQAAEAFKRANAAARGDEARTRAKILKTSLN